MVQGFGIALDCVFACRVIRAEGTRNKPNDRTDVQNPSSTLLTHDRKDCVRHPHDAQKVGVEQRANLLDRTFLRGPGYGVAGIVDE